MLCTCTYTVYGQQADQMQRSGDRMITQSCKLLEAGLHLYVYLCRQLLGACLDLEGGPCVSWEATLQMQAGIWFLLAAHACHSMSFCQ